MHIYYQVFICVLKKFALGVAFLAVFFASCNNPLADTIDDMVRTEVRPEADCEWRNGYGIDATTAITVTFNKAMDPDSLSALGGSMAPEAETTWQNPQTLVLSPSDGTWSDEMEHTVFFVCSDTEGLDCEFTWIFGIVDHVYYVSPDGNPAGSGRLDDQVSSINSAMWMASDVYPGDSSVEIRVAEGIYTTGSGANQTFLAADGHTMSGGWKSDFSVCDPDIYTTIIDGQANLAGSTNVTFVLEQSGPGTVIEGFTILGPRVSGNTYALMVMNSQGTIRNCRIYAYTGLVLYAYNSSCVIEDNQFITWSGDELDIFFDEGDSVFRRNELESRSPMSKRAVTLWDTDMLFTDNRIELMNSDRDMLHIAIASYYGSPTIRNNLLDGHIGDRVIGLYNYWSSPRILNNTIYVGSGIVGYYGSDGYAYGIDNYGNSFPTLINNLFVANGENQSSIQLLHGSLPAEASYNASYRFTDQFTDYGFDATNLDSEHLHSNLSWQSWELGDDADAALRTGGMDLSASEGFSADINGTSRPAGAWSRGAIQWQ